MTHVSQLTRITLDESFRSGWTHADTRDALMEMLFLRHRRGDSHVRHHVYVNRARRARSRVDGLSHHMLTPDAEAGLYHCPICPRVVIRGMGRWWE